MKKYIAADWKDINGLVEQFQSVIEQFGLNIIEDPIYEGSDTFGFIISDEPIDEIKEGSRFED
jgi:hypothetical protein